MASSYKKIFIQSIFTQINFGLQSSAKILLLVDSSIENICVNIKVDCILRKKNQTNPNMDYIIHLLINDIIFGLRKIGKKSLVLDHSMAGHLRGFLCKILLLLGPNFNFQKVSNLYK